MKSNTGPFGTLSEVGTGSRRRLLEASATSLALAALARAYGGARAQEASPAANATPPAGGLPSGVESQALITAAPVDELPTSPAELYVTRLTLQPGVYFPPAPTPGPETVLVESGVLTCVCGAPGHPCSVLRSNGQREEQPVDQEFEIQPGEILVQPANVPDSAENKGSEPLVLLVVDIFPAMGVATPTG